MLKCKFKIVRLETSLESVLGFDRSEFGWQRIPDCWSCKRNAHSANVVRVRGLMKVIDLCAVCIGYRICNS